MKQTRGSYKSYYKVLEVGQEVSVKEIKKQYYKLARQYHPDKNRDSEAENIFKGINEAYEVLSDEAKRKRYDEYLREIQNGNINPEDTPFYRYQSSTSHSDNIRDDVNDETYQAADQLGRILKILQELGWLNMPPNSTITVTTDENFKCILTIRKQFKRGDKNTNDVSLESLQNQFEVIKNNFNNKGESLEFGFKLGEPRQKTQPSNRLLGIKYFSIEIDSPEAIATLLDELRKRVSKKEEGDDDTYTEEDQSEYNSGEEEEESEEVLPNGSERKNRSRINSREVRERTEENRSLGEEHITAPSPKKTFTFIKWLQKHLVTVLDKDTLNDATNENHTWHEFFSKLWFETYPPSDWDPVHPEKSKTGREKYSRNGNQTEVPKATLVDLLTFFGLPTETTEGTLTLKQVGKNFIGWKVEEHRGDTEEGEGATEENEGATEEDENNRAKERAKFIVKLPFKIIWHTVQAVAGTVINVIKLPLELLPRGIEGLTFMGYAKLQQATQAEINTVKDAFRYGLIFAGMACIAPTYYLSRGAKLLGQAAASPAKSFRWALKTADDLKTPFTITRTVRRENTVTRENEDTKESYDLGRIGMKVLLGGASALITAAEYAGLGLLGVKVIALQTPSAVATVAKLPVVKQVGGFLSSHVFDPVFGPAFHWIGLNISSPAKVVGSFFSSVFGGAVQAKGVVYDGIIKREKAPSAPPVLASASREGTSGKEDKHTGLEEGSSSENESSPRGNSSDEEEEVEKVLEKGKNQHEELEALKNSLNPGSDERSEEEEHVNTTVANAM